MAATQRESFYPTDRTNSQFMPLKVFGSKSKLRHVMHNAACVTIMEHF